MDCCLIAESPFYVEIIRKRLKENGHMVIVIIEGVELFSESMHTKDQQDATPACESVDISEC